ncbi:hypothetical protein ACIOMM_30805 [Streptomyces sp. NPDC087908]|uniref:hypothetical protein n=1 Tax=Streptomyces sp. NPDC087908 TaxID=3365820 RepID=UPI003830B6B2
MTWRVVRQLPSQSSGSIGGRSLPKIANAAAWAVVSVPGWSGVIVVAMKASL